MKRQSTHLTILALLASCAAVLAGPAPGPSGKKTVTPVEEEDIVVHPITSPYWNEDSFITSDLRPVFVQHNFPGDVLGGHANVSAAQLRIRLTDSLQLVAYKDGWVNIDSPGLKANGWNDIALGLKWAFYQNEAAHLHAAAGIGYEFASGDDNVLQEDDELRLWLSLNKGFGKLHLGATVNYLKSMGNGDDILGNSDTLSWHLHADYQVCRWFSSVLEVNGYHVVNESQGPVTPFSGVDVADLGGNRNENVITAAAGVEFRPCHRFAVRAAYEVPLSDNVDLYGDRWTFSAVIKF